MDKNLHNIITLVNAITYARFITAPCPAYGEIGEQVSIMHANNKGCLYFLIKKPAAAVGLQPLKHLGYLKMEALNHKERLNLKGFYHLQKVENDFCLIEFKIRQAEHIQLAADWYPKFLLPKFLSKFKIGKS